jgi:hypothetical protein
MLLSWNKLQKYKVQATDGVVGALDGVYFIGSRFSWMIRYFAVNVTEWMQDKKVLIPLDVIGRPFRDLKKLPVNVSTEEVKNSRIFSDENLVGTRDIIGYTLTASDGGVGYVEDLIVDDSTWEIKYLVVSLWEYASQKRVLVPPKWIEEIVANDKDIRLNVLNGQVSKAVPYELDVAPNTSAGKTETRTEALIKPLPEASIMPKTIIMRGRWST